MNQEKTTRNVVRLMMAWNDQKEERWLAEQERSGWRVTAVRCFGYTLERATPAEVAYRLDFAPSRRHDRQEYLSLFKDAGWEHLGARGRWQVFRKPVVDGQVPEIYTDAQSRIAMYRRVMGLLAVMTCVILSQMATNISHFDSSGAGSAKISTVFALQLTVVGFLLYGVTRLLLVIRRIRKTDHPQS